MMPDSQSDHEILSFYHELIEQLQEGYLAPFEVSASVCRNLNRSPSSDGVIKQLLAEAEGMIWYAPYRSWATAHIAYAASLEMGQESLKAEVALVLAAALNALGRFGEALPLLYEASECLLSHAQQNHAIRCNIEIALACIRLDRLEAAQAALTRARDLLTGLNDPFLQAHFVQTEGLLHLAQNRYSEAVALFRQAGDAFTSNLRPGEAALVWCDLALAIRYLDPQEALNWLNRARRVPDPGDSGLHAARCDYVLALIFDELNRYAESLNLYHKVHAIFLQEGMNFLAAFCDVDRGIAHYRLNQYEEALRIYHRARASFVDQGLSSQVAKCDLNIAIIYYVVNRYAEALTLYQRVSEAAETEGRTLRAARCYTNMGECYDRLGRYDRALVLHDRARQAFLKGGSPVYAALCQENLAGTYFALGRCELALTHFQQAREIFFENQMAAYTAYCDTQIASLYLALDRPEEARTCLEHAHQLYSEAGMAVKQALCERLLGQVARALGEYELGLHYVTLARETLIRQNMVVEIALCDMAEGEICLKMDGIQRAEELFQRANAVLSPGFPDQAWRAAEGLGRCKLIQGDGRGALHHYTLAASFITRARDLLPTERLSGDFFAGRRHVFQSAIELALELDHVEEALSLAEATKARSFLTQNRPLCLRADHRDDPYLAGLVAREDTLRRRLDSLRNQLTIQDKRDEPSLNVVTRGEQEFALQELADLSSEYEEVIEQLRLATASARMMLPSFSVASFREIAAVHLPEDWACLEYFMSGEQIVIFYLDAKTLRAYIHRLTSHDRLILQQCVSPETDRRELIYRGTVRGFRVPDDPGRSYRRHLSQLLIPPEVQALSADDLLIVIPHGPLHSLPFHTLFVEEQTLMERVPFLYIPSLQALESLWGREAVETVGEISLLCGLEDFDGRARPLPHAGREVQIVADALRGEAQILYGEEATACQLKQMSASGQLSRYDLVHFATHTITVPDAPTLSRVLLADEGLTVGDVLELEMSARLVTLSTCQAAVGEVKPGDEMMTLARAFFYAGAQAVVASLWAVEDEATQTLMGHFYQRLQMGESIPQALRQAQVMVYNEGCTAYQWAPFLAIGRP